MQFRDSTDNNNSRTYNASSSSVNYDEKIVDEMCVLLRNEFKKHLRIKRNGDGDWQAIFDYFDSDGSGEIPEEEMKQSLKKMGLDTLNRKQLRLLIQRFDVDDKGFIDLDDFIQFGEGDGPKLKKGTSTRTSNSPTKRKSRSAYDEDDDDEVLKPSSGAYKDKGGVNSKKSASYKDDDATPASGINISVQVFNISNYRASKKGVRRTSVSVRMMLLPWNNFSKETKAVKMDDKAPSWTSTDKNILLLTHQ